MYVLRLGQTHAGQMHPRAQAGKREVAPHPGRLTADPKGTPRVDQELKAPEKPSLRARGKPDPAISCCLFRMTRDKEMSDLFTLDGIVKGHRIKILVDSGANGEFISTNLANALKLHTVSKLTPDAVRMANGQELRSSSVTRLSYTIKNYHDADTFHIVDLEGFDMVLGKPWLTRINPKIDWRRGTLTFSFRGEKIYLFSSP